MKRYLQLLICGAMFLTSYFARSQNSVVVKAFIDSNGDGIDNDGFIEGGISTATLILWEGSVGGTMHTHVESTPGFYTFDDAGAGLPDGTYILQYLESPWTIAATIPGSEVTAITLLNVGGATTDNDVDPVTGLSTGFGIAGSQMEVDIDLGLYFTSAIGDFVFEDTNGDGLSDGEPGIGGVTVTLLDGLGAPALDTDMNPVPTQNTDALGNYIFGNLGPGDYIVQFSLPTAPTANGMNWVATTFNGGNPDFANDSDADPANALQSPIYTIDNNIIYNENIDAGFYVPVKIGNYVFCDVNGNGINDGEGPVEGLTITLQFAGGGIVTTDAEGNPLTNPVQSDAAGMYMFSPLPPGDYRISAAFAPNLSSPPFTFSPANQGGPATDSDIDPNSGQSAIISTMSDDLEIDDIDIGVFQLISFEGTVWYDDNMDNTFNGAEGGPGGVLIELFNSDTNTKTDETLTGSGGNYVLTNIPPGNYYIQIGAGNFASGGSLSGASGCPGSNSAGDMVDNDDNAPDSEPGAIITDVFVAMSNCDKLNPPTINYIDFCFFFNCNEENNLAADACSFITPADIICDVNTLATFCAIMPTGDSPGAQPQPLCTGAGGQAHNISWFAFVAYGGTYSVTVTPTNCTTVGNNAGVQLGLYTDCTFTESVYCQDDCSTNPVTFNSDVMEEGQTYYFFIDGCAGSVCSYEVSISGNPLPPNLEPDDVCIDNNGSIECQDITLCPNADVTFVADGLDLTVDFTWEISTVSGAPYTGASPTMTTEEMLTLNFPDEGVYQVCVTTISNGCQVWAGVPYCRTVTIAGIPDEEFDPVSVCTEELTAFNPSVLAPSDPNGDGVIGWQGPTTGLIVGTNMFMVTDANGCMYDQEFDLMTYPVAPNGLVDMTICKEDLPLTIDAIQITDLSFGGNTIFTLQDFLLTQANDVNGCDSIIDITIEQLVVFNGSIAEGACLPEGVILNFVYDPSLSTEIENMTFVWTDPAGSDITDDWNPLDPQDIIAPTGSGNGTYTLTITINKNGHTCTFDYPIDIDFDQYLPPTPAIDGLIAEICESDSIAIYTAINGGDAFSFTWTIPTGVSSTISGTNGEIVTVNWSGSTGGSVSVFSENACGASQEVTLEVAVNTQLTPNFSIDSEACVDSSATVTFVGPTGNISTYMWNFDGGTVTNGTGGIGVGPHDVSWNTPGDKIVTLTVVDMAGCESTTAISGTSVVSPIAPPNVLCNPATGEVTFTWADVTGATGYAVNVTSGQSGTLSGNSFTVSGLSDGETVTIELIVFTNDACQMVVGSAPACTAQNCVAPTISLAPDVTSVCLDASTGNINIVPTIVSGESGSGMFSGPGIIDAVNGIFDPNLANFGNNTITYSFVSTDDCIGQQSTVIEVLETPMAAFTSDVDTICISDVFNLNYGGTANVNTFDWDYGTGGSAAGGPTPVVTYTTAGEKTITLQVIKDGCVSETVTKTVFVEPELVPVVVNCVEQNLNSILFGWTNVVGATGYEVTVNGMTFVTTDLTHLEVGLNPGDLVDITVTVLTDSRCPGSSDSNTCEAKECPSFTIDINVPVVDFCVDGTNALVDLVASASGGDGSGTFTWVGPNVTGTQFDPNGLADGQYELFVNYEENNCDGSESIFVNITEVPVADFDISATTICVGETTDILFTGSQLPGQTYIWTSGGSNVVPGPTANSFMTTFSQVGSFDVSLQLENGDCPSNTMTATVVVEPELVFDNINCAESLDQIDFSWNPVACATEYEVFIDGVSQGTQTNTDFSVTGLNEGQEVMIEVIAVSGCACGNVMQTRMCEAMACPTITINLSATEQVFCLDADAMPVEIIDEVLGSAGTGLATWVGNGVNANGVFDPQVAGLGTHVITFEFIESAGCDYMEQITFTVNDTPDLSADFESFACYDQATTTVDLLPIGGDGNYTLTLNGNPANLTNEIGPGSYTVAVVDGNMCTAETSFTVNQPSEPQPVISGATDLIVGESSTYSIDPLLFAEVSLDSVIWTANGVVICNDPISCFGLSQSPTENTTYVVTVYYNSTCSVTTSLTVTVEEPKPISIFDIPNIISPNDDGNNDEWILTSNDPELLVRSVNIYDRWGNLVFTHGAGLPGITPIVWNGKMGTSDLLPGVYVYSIDFNQEGRDKFRSGDITIIDSGR